MIVSVFGIRLGPCPRKVRVAWAENFRGSLNGASPNGYRRAFQMRLALWLCFSLELLNDTLNMHDRLRSQCRYLLTELPRSSADGASCCQRPSLSRTYSKISIGVWNVCRSKTLTTRHSASVSISLTKRLMYQTGSSPKGPVMSQNPQRSKRENIPAQHWHAYG
jgi:hypothetical protein